MEIETRTDMVRRLAKPGEAIIATMTAHQASVLHMAVGIADEASELLGATSRKNILEELGDAEFYLEGALQTMGWENRGLVETGKIDGNPDYALNALVVAAGEVLGDAKRYAIQNKALNEDKLLVDLSAVATHLKTISDAYGFTDEEIHAANFEKLVGGAKARYKDGYSDAAAHARADKA